MKMKANLLVVLLMLSMISAIPMIATRHVSAEPVPDGSKIVWEDGTGAAAATLKWNPEFLELLTMQYTEYDTIVTIDGKDTYGQVIEASVYIPAGSAMSSIFTFLDCQSGCPVAFAEIDNIFQKYGTNGDQFEILTCPVPYETTGTHIGQYYGQYLGEYYKPSSGTFGYYPGYNDYINNAYGTFLVANGQGNSYGTQPYPVEPYNPDPLVVYINWKNYAEDLYPKAGEFPTGGARTATVLTIEGMDENGNKAIGLCTIGKNDTMDQFYSSTPRNSAKTSLPRGRACCVNRR